MAAAPPVPKVSAAIKGKPKPLQVGRCNLGSAGVASRLFELFGHLGLSARRCVRKILTSTTYTGGGPVAAGWIGRLGAWFQVGTCFTDCTWRSARRSCDCFGHDRERSGPRTGGSAGSATSFRFARLPETLFEGVEFLDQGLGNLPVELAEELADAGGLGFPVGLVH